MRGQPREQYSRVYVLLPPTATNPAWVTAVANATWATRRFTIGASADDAGIGNLHARMVVAVNPQDWGTAPPLDQWFAQYYSGVVYVPLYADSPDDLANQLKQTPLPAPVVARASPPQPPQGAPREQYARSYVLFNPTQTDPTWVTAVAATTWARRVTLGGSADDAGIGDLDTRQAVIINPRQGYNADILSWFAQYYPAVDLRVVEGTTPDDVAIKVKQALGM